jgi:hypothetical protein
MGAGLRHGVDPPKGEGQWLVKLSNSLVALRVPYENVSYLTAGIFSPRSMMNERLVKS